MNLEARGLGFAYAPERPVLHAVDLCVAAGQVTLLLGPNGCGKSTLLRCLNGTLRPQTGEVRLDGQSLAGGARPAIARRIAVVPQHTPADLPFTVAEMVGLGRYAHGDAGGPVAAEAVAESLTRVGIAGLAARRFDQLSGGERQRVLVARALAQQGAVLLLDEPAAHLDLAHRLEVYALARRQAAAGQIVLMVCHDLLLAPLFADRCVLLAEGRLLAQGPAEEVLRPAQVRQAYGCDAALAWDAAQTAVHARFAPPARDAPTP